MYENYFDNDDARSTDMEESSLSTLKQYLSNNITSQVAAEQLKIADPGYLLVHAASRLPEAHPQLVELVAALMNTDTRTLDGLYIELRESWNHFDPDTSVSYQSEDRTEWVAINAFTAHLLVRFPDESFLRFGIYSLRDTLENTSWERRTQDGTKAADSDLTALDGLVPAAAQWIFTAGRQMYASDFTVEDHSTCREKWASWRQGFANVAEMERLDMETRRMAKEAADVMVRMSA